MIKRIVKMTFKPEAVNTFIQDVFEQSKANIRAFPGCRHMELLRYTEQPAVLFTLSIWDSAEALEAYRQSELFGQTWAKTKALFAEKADAWSLNIVDMPALNSMILQIFSFNLPYFLFNLPYIFCVKKQN
jgi:quinol monooxygenase YgiN